MSSAATSKLIPEEQERQYRQQGFLVLENYFSIEEIDQLNQVLDQQLNPAGAKMLGSRSSENAFSSGIAERIPALMAFARAEKLSGLAYQLLKHTACLYWNRVVYQQSQLLADRRPAELPWHQDNSYTNFVPQEFLTCWIALSAATPENGCLWVIPQSHRNGTAYHIPTPMGNQCLSNDSTAVAVPIRKGGLMLFSSLLCHRSGVNLTRNEVRKAFLLQYISQGTCHAESRKVVEAPVVFG